MWVNNDLRLCHDPQRSAFSAFTNGDFCLDAHPDRGYVVAVTNHYLADYRTEVPFIQTNWMDLDLTWMPPDVVSLVGTLTTSDVGINGPNTPMYFALADFTYAYADASGGIAASNPAICCWADGWKLRPGPNVDLPWGASNAWVLPGSLDGLGATNGIVSPATAADHADPRPIRWPGTTLP